MCVNQLRKKNMLTTRLQVLKERHGIQTDLARKFRNQMRRNEIAKLPNADRYETVLVAAHRNPLRASNGIRLVADLTFEEVSRSFDIILVAGAPTPPEAEPEPCLIQWVKELPRRSSVYGSRGNRRA
jgi:transcriptional regulator GlxA family with amidase domain